MHLQPRYRSKQNQWRNSAVEPEHVESTRNNNTYDPVQVSTEYVNGCNEVTYRLFRARY